MKLQQRSTYEPDSAIPLQKNQSGSDGINPTLDASPEIGRIEEPNEFSGVPTSPGNEGSGRDRGTGRIFS